ncbi:MAG: CcmD family protein [Sphingobacteriales bacterium]|nr:MAG: CcmD family protein [Sphingobacteriales bacterium]TAF82114.1 MAG: CcmD family protein [Sphingobacteriales bacterium]
MKKFLLITIYLITSVAVKAQTVEMADVLRSSGKIYVVVATIAIIFVGLTAYLFMLDKRLTKLERNK